MKYELIIDPNREEQIIVIAHSPGELTRRIEGLVQAYSEKEGLTVYGEQTSLSLPYGKIECITVEDRKVYAIYEDGKKYRCSERLYELEERLPSYFIRINKSTLANEHRIERFCPTYSGGVDAVFLCGHRDYVSRRCLAEIKRRLDRT
ncbi:MAG: LytTR family transcriptional regulator [Oscillospiraceae bacterium]|nr:LytTR family transcriptional regulator [Oscillospiraceae bacterium]